MSVTHLVTGYAGVEHIQAEDDGAFNAAFFGNGQFVMQSGNQFEGSIIDNNTVRILDGDLLTFGRHVRIKPNAYEDLTITTGTAGTNRYDLICMTYERSTNDGTEKAYLEVIQGEESESTPSLPNYIVNNILLGAAKNQMPMYKVVLEGVVLKEIIPMFITCPTYKTLADRYKKEFQTACETHLDSLNVLDTMEEVQANTQSYQLAGALALKELEATLKKSVSDGKTLVADAITTKLEVETAADASFETMANNILNSNLISVICLGSGTTFDIASLLPNIDYTQLTVDNFLIAIERNVDRRIIIHGYAGDLENYSSTICGAESVSKSYDSNTGVFTCSASYTIDESFPTGRSVNATVSEMGKCDVYLVLGEIETL